MNKYFKNGLFNNLGRKYYEDVEISKELDENQRDKKVVYEEYTSEAFNKTQKQKKNKDKQKKSKI